MAIGNPVYGSGLIDLKPDISQQNLGGLRAGLSGAMGGIAVAAAGVFVAGFAAAVAAGVKGVGAFAELQRGMNEVFTLLPGISKPAMDELTGQVRGFSKEFAVLPDQVVPALYQALSAGVPKDNVFEFLETAQKAALGGVTELETAVDGISSVVNAYGSDVIGAGEASDLMFTAVRLGKTTFEELSGSLFNVIPTASALGVGFGDITAALATMTAQGVPTSVATTQMRQLFVELSKEGTVAADVLKDRTGKSFAELTAEGFDTNNILHLLVDASHESGTALQDMFGSVEAGAAALSLTGSESFFENIQAMGESAGATDAAYEQMDQGLSRTWDRIKVTFNDAFLEIGERLAPHIQEFSTWFSEKLPGIIDKVTDWFSNRLLPAVMSTIDWVRSNVVPVIRDQVVPAFRAVIDAVRSVLSWWQGLNPEGKRLLGTLLLAAGGAIAAFKAGMMLVKGFQAVKAGFMALKLLMATNPFLLLIAAVTALVIFVITNWDKIKAGIKVVWDWIKRTADTVWTAIRDAFKKAVDFVKNLFLNFTPLGLIIKNFDAIKNAATSVKDWIMDRVDDVVGFFRDMPGRISRVVGGLFDGLKNAFKNAVNWIIRKWNDFRIQIQLPSILGGGKISIDTPNIPLFDSGGLVDGAPGEHVLGILKAGERVLTEAQNAAFERGVEPGMLAETMNFFGLPSQMARQVAREMTWAAKTAGV